MQTRAPSPWPVIPWRGLSYADGLARQREAVRAVADDPGAPERLLAAEHLPTITLGRSDRGGRHLLVSPDECARRGVTVIEASRGGDVTWHGPGQWTVYPVIRLRDGERDVLRFLRVLEQGVIDWLADHQVEGYRREGASGVWVGSDKLAAIGVSFRRWVSGHGLAVNIDPDLEAPRRWIVPCGINASQGGITSLARITGRAPDMDAEAPKLAACLARALGRNMVFFP